MKSKQYSVEQNKRGAITKLTLNDDPTRMNWVIDPKYLKQVGYKDDDKLFGEFHIKLGGKEYQSINYSPSINIEEQKSESVFDFGKFKVSEQFILDGLMLRWKFSVENLSSANLTIDDLGIWISLAYVMFRDKNVHRNANQSVAVFPSISKNYTKLAALRRDNTSPNMGVYQLDGNVLSVGTFNDYTNRFFENVSPSLDGMLFHEFVLAGGYSNNQRAVNDWIYPQNKVDLRASSKLSWEFGLHPFQDKQDFYSIAKSFGHPRLSFEPLVSQGQKQTFKIGLSANQKIKSFIVRYKNNVNLVSDDITTDIKDSKLTYQPNGSVSMRQS